MMPKVRTHLVRIDSLYVNVSIPQTPRAFICLARATSREAQGSRSEDNCYRNQGVEQIGADDSGGQISYPRPGTPRSPPGEA